MWTLLAGLVRWISSYYLKTVRSPKCQSENVSLILRTVWLQCPNCNEISKPEWSMLFVGQQIFGTVTFFLGGGDMKYHCNFVRCADGWGLRLLSCGIWRRVTWQVVNVLKDLSTGSLPNKTLPDMTSQNSVFSTLYYSVALFGSHTIR